MSCDTNWGNYDGYLLESDSKIQRSIVLDKADTLSISAGDTRMGISPYPGTFFTFHHNAGKIETCFFGQGAILIDSYINEVRNNKDFLLVMQTSMDKICECNPECLEEKYGIESYSAASFRACRKALNESGLHDFWIIIKQTNEIFGPYSFEKYVLMRDSLNVPHELQLSFERS